MMAQAPSCEASLETDRADLSAYLAGLREFRHCLVTMPIASMIPIFAVLIVLSPIVGSFLGVLIRRIPRGEPFIASRSHCESCRASLRPTDLVPIVSFLFCRGTCRRCGSRIDRMHLIIELAACVVPITAVLARPISAWLQDIPLSAVSTDIGPILAECFLGWGLLVLAWIDMTCLRLPDVLTLPLLLVGLGEGYLLHGPDEAMSRALGSGGGWLLFAGIAYGYRRLRGRAGLGGGDVKLLAMGGAWDGLSALPLIVGLGAALGLLFALTTAFRSRRFSTTILIPFGPCLAAAIWLARLFPFVR